ncbi:hypothetical protein AAGS40_20980 [Paraburkholderia sp. PREW-6R]|uniref:hypothetical protein n=1 Tax=Paraburkholderia sp. PREW-6R TaxID=3141544 RepID=UPI0031F4B89B
MAINITTTRRTRESSDRQSPQMPGMPVRNMPGWLWFVVLWCFGVACAVSLGFAFKMLMNATLFAVR